ncbi:MAG: hypothetical protein B6U72_04530 [Candidatus Altiarchaeales archaeon ex4484_2]|nr:MAG: hypothetical protein B6U72_04530 [Candidatus Altiarchaeales archaeon ex4484_2]
MEEKLKLETMPATVPIDGEVLEVEPSIDFTIRAGTTTILAMKTPSGLSDNEIQLLNRVSKLEKEIEELKKANEPHVIVLQEISREEAKQRIKELLDGLKEGEQIYPDEIANKLGIDFLRVMNILDELEKDERIEVVNSG